MGTLAALGRAAMLLGLALTACGADDEIVIGSAQAATFFLAPTGNDNQPGTRDQPWRTFAKAIPRLGPGTTLVLRAGTYQPATTGTLDVQCGKNASNGRIGAPVTIRAEEERAAFLRGNGMAAPFVLQGCSWWTIDGLHIESMDAPGGDTAVPESGSVVVLADDNHDIVLRRLLLARPNRFRHSHVLRVGERSSNVLVEENELYDFHHNGFEIARATATILRRNYVHSRLAGDVPGGYVSPPGSSGARGDFGFILEEARFSIVEDNVVEAVSDGFGVVGRYEELPSGDPAPATNPVDGNRLLGNVALASTGAGFMLASRCRGEVPCSDRPRIVVGTDLFDNVAIGGLFGLLSRGAIGTQVQQFSARGAATGIAMTKSADNTGLRATSFTSNALAADHSQVGFSSEGEAEHGFDHCAPLGPGPGFAPSDDRVTSVIAADTNAVGACLIYLPPQSPLTKAGAGARAVGGQIRNRHQDGVVTANPLWDPVTGAFPCGAIVAGVNDDPTQSCSGVHERLRVGTAGCPLP